MGARANPETQRLMIEAILAGASEAQVAAHAKVDVKTVYRARRRDGFIEALREAKRELQGRTRTRLQGLAGPAAAYLGKVFADEEEPTALRIAAARTILEYAQGSIELDDLDERVAELEKPLPPKPLEIAAKATPVDAMKRAG